MEKPSARTEYSVEEQEVITEIQSALSSQSHRLAMKEAERFDDEKPSFLDALYRMKLQR